jgi:hypothetical protein
LSAAHLFIEAAGFTSVVKHYFGGDEEYADFQTELGDQPDKGSVIPGAAPLRKLRWADRRRGTGKRGGLRIIYLHIPELRVLFLIDVYGKDESDDLTAAEKKDLKALAKELQDELKKRHEKGKL